MGEMSSIVSRSPSSMNHLKEAFWMSIRLGTSSTWSRREKLLRSRRAATFVAKSYDLPPGRVERTMGVRHRGTAARLASVADSPDSPQGKPSTVGLLAPPYRALPPKWVGARGGGLPRPYGRSLWL